MDFESPDVEKDFPGLYASESGGRHKKNNDEDDFSDGVEHEKLSTKELLLGRRKEKKDKKDRGYATLDGESSAEEEPEVKSPSKIKKSKAFKFTSSKSKDKREKSREKESAAARSLDYGLEPTTSSSTTTTHNSLATATGTTITTEFASTGGSGGGFELIGPLHKKDKKDKKEKEKEKKDKSVKDKDKKDKKSKHGTGNPSAVGGLLADTELLELGDAQPIFGVSLGLAVERSRCHDQVNLPLVVRDCIDYLQASGLHSAELYRVDAGKQRLQQLRRAYNNRESLGTADWDVPTACGLLKLFFRELPEPILTTDLSVRFEEAAAQSLVAQQHADLLRLIRQLPSSNQTLLAWTLCHFDAVIQHEQRNRTNAQSLAVLLSPVLQMSHRLLVCMLCHCSTLFEGVVLAKYVPPMTATSPHLPDTIDAIAMELRKQDSLLNQIHAEMNAGFVTKKREEQLWEVQRIITQLKRKLRSFEKQQQQQFLQQQHNSHTESGDSIAAADQAPPPPVSGASLSAATSASKPSYSDDDASLRTATVASTESTPHTNNTGTKSTPQQTPTADEPDACVGHADAAATAAVAVATKVDQPLPAAAAVAAADQMHVHPDTGLLLLPVGHPDGTLLLRLQLENVELAKWKAQLQERINAARADVVWLRTALRQLGDDCDPDGVQQHSKQHQLHTYQSHPVLDNLTADELSGYEQIVAHYAQENALLEHKKQLLVREVFEGNVELIQMQVNWTMRNLKY